MDVHAWMAERIPPVEAALEHWLPPADRPPTSLHAAMRHLVFPGGKRLRPALALAAAEASAGPASAALPVATVSPGASSTSAGPTRAESAVNTTTRYTALSTRTRPRAVGGRRRTDSASASPSASTPASGAPAGTAGNVTCRPGPCVTATATSNGIPADTESASTASRADWAAEGTGSRKQDTASAIPIHRLDA